MSKFYSPIPEVTRSEIAYQGYFDVHVDQLQLAQGLERPYTLLHLGADAAAVIALTREKQLVTVHEYRHPAGQWLISCPGGRIDSQETPLAAAKRELLEETGYGGGEFFLLGSVYPFPAVASQKIFFILAENVTYLQPPTLEPLELIQVHLRTRKAVMAEIAAGEPVDGVFLAGLLMWDNRPLA